MPDHPSAVVPVTENVVVAVGLTVTVKLEPRQSDQINIVPVISELAFSSVLNQKQISYGVAVAVIDGNGRTVTVTSAMPVNPSAVEHETKNVVVKDGITVTI